MSSGFLGGGVGPVALKRRAAAANWWEVPGQTCVAAYQPIGAASLAASYINLANPGTYDAAPGVAPTLAAGGWVGDGSRWLNTGIATWNTTWSLIVRFLNMPLNPGLSIGLAGVADNGFWGIYNYIGAGLVYIMNGVATTYSHTATSGVYALAGTKGYIDGVHRIETMGSVSLGKNIHLLALNSNIYPLNGTIAAVAIYSTTLSAADVAALTTRMQALT